MDEMGIEGNSMMSINGLFWLGMKRAIPDLLDAPGHVKLNLGSGNQSLPGFINLDYPEWDAEDGVIPYHDNSVHCIYAFHFLEHLKDPRIILRECFRVLVPGGIMNIIVPYYTSQMQAHDLDHKACFCEETWVQLLRTSFYKKDKMENMYRIGTNIIIGVAERNLALMTQLIKLEKYT